MSPSKVEIHVICKLMPLFRLYRVTQWLSFGCTEWHNGSLVVELCCLRHSCAHPLALGSAQPTALLETISWNNTNWNTLLLLHFSVQKLLKLSKQFYKILFYEQRKWVCCKFSRSFQGDLLQHPLPQTTYGQMSSTCQYLQSCLVIAIDNGGAEDKELVP